MDTFKEFRKNMRKAELDDTVVPIVSTSAVAARSWNTPLDLVFIDGIYSSHLSIGFFLMVIQIERRI